MSKNEFEPGETILVVDDSASALALSRQVLVNLGFQVTCLKSGTEALDWLANNPASLVLLDFRLPDMTGRDVIGALAERGVRVPFITMTAHGDEKLAVEMMKLGALDYLVKDHVFAEMLPTVVRQVLERLENQRRIEFAERSVRESEGRFRSFFENAAAGMVVVSPQGRILQVNPEMCRFVGYEAAELLNLNVSSITHPSDRETSLELYSQLREGKRAAFDFEKRYLRKDGSVVWGHASVSCVHDESGNLRYCVALVQDITGRKRYEELVENIERGVSIKIGDDFFRSLTSCLAEALKADQVFVCELLDRDTERVRTIAAVIDGRESEPFEYSLPGTPCEKAFRRNVCVYTSRVAEMFPEDRDLTEHGIEGYAGASLFDSGGETLGLLVALFKRRIEDPEMVDSVLQVFSIRASAELQRRRSEQEMAQREKQYKALSQEFQALLDGIPDVLLLLAPEMKVIWANRGAQGRLDPSGTLGKELYCHHFCMGTPRLEACSLCPVKAGFSTGESTEEIIKHPDSTLWGVKTFPLKDREGQVNRVIMLASDITEKVRFREESARTGRLAAIGELAAGVAHEVNNPTGLILMNMPAVKEAFRDILPILEEHFRLHGDFVFGGLKYSRMKVQMPLLLEEILDGAQRIKNIVNDMKDFARGGMETDSRLFDLNAVLEKVLRLVATQVRASTDRFSCSMAENLPQVRGVPQRIEQVLVNLIINACQALPGKERALHVSTGFDPVLCLCNVVVADEGIGIPENNLPHLIDPFFTTRREKGGTGLGLSISARIVSEHGGRLQYESMPGRGTTVTMTLPAILEEK